MKVEVVRCMVIFEHADIHFFFVATFKVKSYNFSFNKFRSITSTNLNLFGSPRHALWVHVWPRLALRALWLSLHGGSPTDSTP